jgi:hypothetical protein
MPADRKSKETEKQLERIAKVYKLIRQYHSNSYPWRKESNEEEDLGDIIIAAKDIVLNPFIFSPDIHDHFDEQAQQQNMPEEKRLRLYAFLSTPRFILCLTEIS